MRGFAGLDGALLGLGVVDLVAIGLLVVCVRTDATFGQLRGSRRAAVAVALAAASPFVSAVVVVGHDALVMLTRSAWSSTAFNAYLVRDMCCSLLLLLVGAGAAASPAMVAALSTCRLRLTAEQRDLDPRQRRQWAIRGGSPVAAQLALAVCVLANGNVGRALQQGLLLGRASGVSIPELAVAALIMAGLPLAAIAAVVVPMHAATRRARLRPATPPTIPTPARFAQSARFTQ